MKIHTRKKEYRRMIKALAAKGFINTASGSMVPRNQATENSMRRDYYPQNKG